MPVQCFSSTPVARPPGLVPPPVDLSGVTELRLHGVGGATPEQLLGDLAPQHVSGDRIAGFYRTTDVNGRHVEAYSWGGLTSQSGWRVLWVLLFPFALANVAGWMCTRATHRSRWRFRLHRTVARWASLGLTVNLVVLLAMTSMDLIAYQCGGQPGCADDRWWLGPLRWSLVDSYPGRRVLLGALLPFAVLVLLAVLTLRSIERYEQVPPPLATGTQLPRNRRSAAQPGSTLSDRGFWNGRRAALDLGFLHMAAGLAVVALLLAHTAHTIPDVVGVAVAAPGLRVAVLAVGAVVLAGVLAMSALDACPRAAPAGLLAGSVGALAGAGWLAAAQPMLATGAGANLPGLQNAVNLAFAGILGSLLLVLVSSALGGWEKGGFVVFGPLLANVLAVSTLNAALLGVLVSVDRLLGAELAVFRVVLFSLPYLVLVPLAAGLVFGGYQLWTLWRAGAQWRRVKDSYDRHGSGLEDEPEPWRSNALDARDGRKARKWAARVARARRLAEIPRRADKLVTATVAVGVGILLLLQVRVWLLREEVWSTPWTRTLSAYLGIGLPVLVLLLLRRGWRSLDSRKRIGAIWDVFTFWPRAYHPLAPPSYAERAVPELQRRLWRIHDHGGRVVLAAHSQGTVVAAAALLQPEERPAGQRVALVSFGSPLGTLYGWAFPAYFGDELLRLVPASGSGVELHAWRNFYYLTDYIGRTVFESVPGPGVDTELPDPPTSWHIRHQPRPSPGSHSGYWTDPAVWREVDRLAAELAPAGRM